MRPFKQRTAYDLPIILDGSDASGDTGRLRKMNIQAKGENQTSDRLTWYTRAYVTGPDHVVGATITRTPVRAAKAPERFLITVDWVAWINLPRDF